jgi:hypothetical protein
MSLSDGYKVCDHLWAAVYLPRHSPRRPLEDNLAMALCGLASKAVMVATLLSGGVAASSRSNTLLGVRTMFRKGLATDRGDCMPDKDSGQESVRQISDEGIEMTFNALIERWEESESARYDLEAFKRANPEPTPPPRVFGDIEELTLFNRRKWHYEHEAEERTARHEERVSKFEAVAQTVKLLLPVSHTLAHTYSGDLPDLQGAGYSIQHLYGPRPRDPSEVSVKKTRLPRPPTS